MTDVAWKALCNYNYLSVDRILIWSFDLSEFIALVFVQNFTTSSTTAHGYKLKPLYLCRTKNIIYLLEISKMLPESHMFDHLVKYPRSNGSVLICDLDWQAQLICAGMLGAVTAWFSDLAADSWLFLHFKTIFLFIFLILLKKYHLSDIQDTPFSIISDTFAVLLVVSHREYSKEWTSVASHSSL